jgi:8-amino-3,8-dideoxy-alpha-D-manno-octulosonate transaminase
MKNEWPSEFPGVNWIGAEEESAVLDVLRKKTVFRYYGLSDPPHVAALEEWAREYYGVRHALAVNSGTGALFTAMSALGVGPGCEVILPSFLWVATTSAVVHCNAIPVLCEVDQSFNLDPLDLRDKINERTKLIVAVHMAGTPCDMHSIMQIAAEYKVPVLEDCAQCNGGTFNGRKVGTFGKVGMFSFQVNKNITAGEGGLVVTDDAQLYERLNATHDLGVPWKDGQPEEAGSVHIWGLGRRMSELIGAVANIQLRKLPAIVDHMRSSKQRIRETLEQSTDLSLRHLNDPEGDTGPFLVMSFSGAGRAKRFIHELGEIRFGYACRLSDYGLHIYSNIASLVGKAPLSAAGNPWSLPQNSSSNYNYAKGACPYSDALFDRSVIISIPSRLSSQQEDEMIEAIRGAAARCE